VRVVHGKRPEIGWTRAITLGRSVRKLPGPTYTSRRPFWISTKRSTRMRFAPWKSPGRFCAEHLTSDKRLPTVGSQVV